MKRLILPGLLVAAGLALLNLTTCLPSTDMTFVERVSPGNERIFATTSQRTGPQQCYYKGRYERTYFVWQDDDNTPWVAYYDHKTRALAPPVQVATAPTGDPHYHPAVVVDGMGYVHVFYGCHGGATASQWTLYRKKSASAESISTWGSADPISGYATYPNILRSGTTWHLFYRGNETENDNCFYTIRTSTDNGASFGMEHPIVDWHGRSPLSYPYPDCGLALGADKSIHLVLAETQTAKEEAVHRGDLFYLYSTDGGVTWRNAGGTSCWNIVENGPLPYDERNGYRCYAHTYDVYGCDIELDGRNAPLILFREREGSHDGGDWIYKAIRYTAGWQAAVSVADSGRNGLEGDGVLRYERGASFMGLFTIEVNGVSEIHEYRTTDGGTSWVKVREVTTNSRGDWNGLQLAWGTPADDRLLLANRTNEPQGDVFLFGDYDVTYETDSTWDAGSETR